MANETDAMRFQRLLTQIHDERNLPGREDETVIDSVSRNFSGPLLVGGRDAAGADVLALVIT